MKRLAWIISIGAITMPWLVWPLTAQESASFAAIQILTNREASLTVSGAVGLPARMETSSDLTQWSGLVALTVNASPYTDSGAPFANHRFYRLGESGTNTVTGDLLSTADGEVTIHPVYHAGFVLVWNGKVIYCDPTGATRFQGLPRADLILVTHDHSDHFDAATLTAVKGTNAQILAPQAVYKAMSAALKGITTVLTNGSATNVLGLTVEAVPAYNLTASHHLKGVGNGYVLTVGGKRIYISGDTEDTPELRGLQDIDLAFVCMNLPYTMSVEKAVSAVREFQPKVVYVYHYQGYSTAVVNQFKQSVGTDRGVEVRLRKWY
jgi:L-ascorbate metabolism protein UlaG (beta-lactamase superfamily)